jgi:cytochrome P450
MLHDENTYPEPESFKPERWLAKPGDFPFAAFGFGRRLCPGLAYSRDHIWIAIASILAAYDIAPAVDAQGQVVPLTEEWTPTLFSCVLL